MAPEDTLEEGIQALLDGRDPSASPDRQQDDSSSDARLRVVAAIARVHRIALFGADVPLDRPSHRHWGPLEIRAEIGRGASGTVYRAWDTRLARDVALKLLTSDAASAHALEEGRLLARLDHPNIVRVFGADTFDGQPGVWMELLDGETLDSILARDGVFSEQETILIGLDLARALAAVHLAGLLHRDVKARNVLRERGGRIVLMDLSAGRFADDGRAVSDGAGTPMYMAPELLDGEAATIRSDVYSLGVLLYRLLADDFPVSAPDLEGLRAAHVHGRSPLIERRADLHQESAAVVERCCHPSPEARHATAIAVETALNEALQHTISARASIAPPSARWWQRLKRRVLTIASAAGIMLCAAWGAFDTGAGRGVRRALGLPVPPRSAVFLTMNGALGIARGATGWLFPGNPAYANTIAVAADLGIRTMSGIPPWLNGTSFGLDGSPRAPVTGPGPAICCFGDGTTDGAFNYAARTDSTLLDPIGSRPLAASAVYRFRRDWTAPELYFPLIKDGLYGGIAYSARTRTFWVSRVDAEGSVIEQWSREGQLLSTPVHISNVRLGGLGVDPSDGTLWAARIDGSPFSTTHLENFATDGRWLGAVEIAWPATVFQAAGLEFEWTARR